MIWNDLNTVQRDAVRTLDGPVMIIAGAGSGKTRVLAYRIAYLLQCGVPAHNILALTFTNKAAREMRERVELLIPGEDAKRIWMGTFHSTFARLLRRDAEKIGYHKSFSIYDTDDAQALVKSVMSDRGINTQQLSASAVRHAISAAKNKMMGPADLDADARDVFGRKVAEVFRDYEARLRSANAMDFDDLILQPIRLFDGHADVLGQYQKLFRFILVDEYQDTNQAQYQIVRRIASEHRNICVVGDDAQSIYAFRGADIRNILEFERDFAGAAVFRLEQNYRSTGNILRGADALIRKNPRQLPKTLWTENPEGDPISIVEVADETEEARRVVAAIQEEGRKRKLQLKDFALLYRTNAQSRALEDALRRNGIPYTIIGGVAFYRRKEVKDILAYLRVLVNPSDDEAVARVINYPLRGIGASSIAKLREYAAEQGGALFEVVLNAATVPGLGSAAVRRIGEFAALIQKYAGLRSKISAGELAASLVDELGIVGEFKQEGTPESRARLENVQELLSAITDFQTADGESTLEQFLAEASLVADVDALDGERNAVTLMTLHAAKGLEFPVVFLTGMEDGLFPSAQSIDRDEVDEERRLCYVGMTRAMQKLYMLHARTRIRWGERAPQIPSRFLGEVDPKSVARETRRARPAQTEFFPSHTARPAAPKKRTTTSEYSQAGGESYSQTDESFVIGTIVLHATFGRGRIMDLQGSGDMARALVHFESVGRKTLVLKFAGLTRAETY
ncbi:MAG: UvrD-helicase domain-containing protein [Ignavibacteriae bacterium]|nr:UvrD-helicase domain-containing protein [Ignavibacteriota bacterium]